MKVYVIVTVCAGCVDDVEGFADEGEAEMFLAAKYKELGIEPGEEGESENDAKLYDLNITTYPTSVAIRRQVI